MISNAAGPAFCPEVILFDWGGTLADVAWQEQRFAEAAAALASWLDVDAARADADSLVKRIYAAEAAAAADPELREADLQAVVREWAGAHGRPLTGARLEDAVDRVGQAWIGSLEPFGGAAEALRQLRDRGCRLGLVSNCLIPRSFCLIELRRQGFLDLLDFQIISSAVGHRKPSPVIYRAALQAAFPQGVPPSLSGVLFVGDSPAFDVAAPADMGMHTALVRCRRGIWPAEDYARAKPDLRLDSVAELPDHLRLP